MILRSNASCVMCTRLQHKQESTSIVQDRGAPAPPIDRVYDTTRRAGIDM